MICYYIEQKNDLIKIVDDLNQTIIYGRRKVDLLGNLFTSVEFENGLVKSSLYDNLFYTNYKIIENTTNLILNFVNKSKVLKINGVLFENKRFLFFNSSLYIYCNGAKVAKISPVNFFSLRDKIEILNENIDFKQVLLYISLTYYISD